MKPKVRVDRKSRMSLGLTLERVGEHFGEKGVSVQRISQIENATSVRLKTLRMYEEAVQRASGARNIAAGFKEFTNRKIGRRGR